MEPITKTELVEKVRAVVKTYPTHLKACQKLKVTPAQMSKTLKGKVNVVPDRLAKSMGYKPVVMYVPVTAAAKKAAAAKKTATKKTTEKKATPAPTPRLDPSEPSRTYEEHRSMDELGARRVVTRVPAPPPKPRGEVITLD